MLEILKNDMTWQPEKVNDCKYILRSNKHVTINSKDFVDFDTGINLKFSKGSVYLNDGKGTKGDFSTKPLTIKFAKDKNGNIVVEKSNFEEIVYVIIFLTVILLSFAVYRYLFRKNVQK